MPVSKALTRCIAFASGVVYVLAFAPFEFSLLAFLTLGSLFGLWLTSATGREAFILGWLFGLGQFGAGVSWMYISLNTFGGMPLLLSWLAVLLLVMGLALFPAVVGLIQHLFWRCNPGTRTLFVMTPTWVLFEWVREWLFTGLPWLSAGYSQTQNALSAWASVGGVYLLSLIVAMVAGAALLLFKGQRLVAVAVAVLLIISTYIIQQQDWTLLDPRSLSVKLVQGNVSIWDKWNPQKSTEILENYLKLSEQGQPTDLIIWPEAAAPVLMRQLPDDFIEKLQAKFKQNSYTMFGVIETDPLAGGFYNSVVATQKQDGFAFYRKIHLVPFGEYLPLKFLLQWVLDYLHIPMSDFSAYERRQPPIDVKGIKIGVSICYEDAFANVIRSSLPQADLLVNVSEDAWFGNSLAPHQRLQMAQMRAIENARTLVRVSNNGLSAVINYKGQITALAPQFETAVFDAQVDIRTGSTPFSVWGHKLVLSIIGLLLLLALIMKWVGLKQK